MVNSNPSSPAHFGLAGTFSAEDIQELLGAMSGEQHRLPEATSPTTSIPPVNEDNNDAAFQRSLAAKSEASSNGDEIDDEAKAQARSERKRSREKQRRSDVNKQFADLTKTLREIENEEDNKSRLPFNPTNRVDLIARTIMHLERLRENNKKQKQEIESLQQQLDQAKKAGEDTAAKLKETMFNQPPQNKQVRLYCKLSRFMNIFICTDDSFLLSLL